MEIIMENHFDTLTTRVFGLEREGARTIFLGFNGQNLVRQELPEDGPMPALIPLLEIPNYMLNDIIKAFMNAAAWRNIRSEKEDCMNGELVAIREHLKDLQKLVYQFSDHLTREVKEQVIIK